ncbi:hypothetical protein J6590_008313 [Homalodisca vitripennis]|nr:hypothetical protein J6590_008313 [Homalodisca vitripennis]
MRQHRMVLEQCVTSPSVAAELKNPSADIVLHQLPQTHITSRAVLHELIEDQVSQADRNPIITKLDVGSLGWFQVEAQYAFMLTIQVLRFQVINRKTLNFYLF